MTNTIFVDFSLCLMENMRVTKIQMCYKHLVVRTTLSQMHFYLSLYPCYQVAPQIEHNHFNLETFDLQWRIKVSHQVDLTHL